MQEAVKRAKAESNMPALSINLSQSKLLFATRIHEDAFELEERVTSMLVFKSKRRVVLRTETPAALLEWMQAISLMLDALDPAAAGDLCCLL